MKLRTLVADDDRLSVVGLLRLLRPYEGEIEVVGVAEDGRDAVEMIDRLKPELVFLDVEMPQLDGFEVTRQSRHRPSVVVFFSASSSYRQQAKEAGSLAYICKPAGQDEMQGLMQQIRQAVLEIKTTPVGQD
jgi:two-component system LytT family response regulator